MTATQTDSKDQSFIRRVTDDLTRTLKTRKIMDAEDRISNLAVNESRGYRLPVSYGNDAFFLSDKAAWAGFYIPSKNWGFLDAETVKGYAHAATGVMRDVFPSEKENAGQLLVTNTTYAPEDWEHNLVDTFKGDATARFAPYIRATREAITAHEFFERETYLMVRIGERGGGHGVQGALRKGMEYLLLGSGMEDTQPSDEEIADWTEVADTTADTMASSWLSAVPINRRQVEWITRQLDSPGLPTPDTIDSADGEEWGAGWWRTVLSSYTEQVDLGRAGKTRYKGVKFDAPTGEGVTYAAFLPLAYIPTRIGHRFNWMHHASSLPFPVDISLRFEIVDPDRAGRLLQRPINAAEAQKEENAEAGVAPDEATQIQQDSLRQVKTRTKLQREPFSLWQAVFCVYDTDKSMLKSKITQLITHYKNMQFQLVNPGLDQRELFYQQFPGGEIEVEDWIHRTSVDYLGFSQPWLTSTVGDRDGTGMYQGYTVVQDTNGQYRQGAPVFYDLLNVVDRKGTAPTEAVAAESGSGKTVSRGSKSAYEDMLRGITQFIWDPKGDFLPLVKYADWLRLDRSKIKLIDLNNAGTSVSLDPFGIAEVDYTDPSNPIDERKTMAVDILNQLLMRDMSEDKENARHLIRTAVDHELAKEKNLAPADIMRYRNESVERPMDEEPCLQGVIRTLQAWKDDAPDAPDARGGNTAKVQFLLSALESHTTSTLGRHLFRRPSEAGSLNVTKGDLVMFVAINMRTTSPGEPQTETTLLPDIIAGLMTDFIRSLLYILPDAWPKCATFDEWHVIKQSNRADALVRWLRRMGRSKRCMVRQMSQSALDFYDPNDPNSSRTSLATVWCGHVDSDTEAQASCTLLGIEQTKANWDLLQRLGKGQFLFRDADGRVAYTQVDIFDADLLERLATEADTESKLEEARLYAEKR